MLTYEEVVKWFEYRDGRLYWKKAKALCTKVGDLADRCITNSGYRRTTFNYKTYCTHRIIWLLVKGYWPEDQINHIDLNKQNNKIENLEECSAQENQQRDGPQKNNTSGARGVYWHKRDKKWQVAIKLEGKSIHIGLFSNFDDAVHSRKEAELKYYGRLCP